MRIADRVFDNLDKWGLYIEHLNDFMTIVLPKLDKSLQDYGFQISRLEEVFPGNFDQGLFRWKLIVVKAPPGKAVLITPGSAEAEEGAKRYGDYEVAIWREHKPLKTLILDFFRRDNYGIDLPWLSVGISDRSDGSQFMEVGFDMNLENHFGVS